MDEGVMVHKANSIAQFFEAYTEEEAIAGVANHIQSYWEPRMRRQLHDYIAKSGAGLLPSVIEAEKRLRPAVVR
jgi:formate dehydrogenase subunit delta